MAHYIDKSALVAEIERRMELRYNSYKTYNSLSDFIAWEELEYFKEEFLPTLEVKEVDLEEEIDLVEDKYHGFESLSRTDIIEIIKHFFELGRTVSNKA